MSPSVAGLKTAGVCSPPLPVVGVCRSWSDGLYCCLDVSVFLELELLPV